MLQEPPDEIGSVFARRYYDGHLSRWRNRIKVRVQEGMVNLSWNAAFLSSQYGAFLFEEENIF